MNDGFNFLQKIWLPWVKQPKVINQPLFSNQNLVQSSMITIFVVDDKNFGHLQLQKITLFKNL
jgi:hypothetical protein